MATSPQPAPAALVTGGAGFIGAHLAARLLRAGARVTALDNLSRPGAPAHLAWLRSLPEAERLEFVLGDTRDAALAMRLARGAEEIYHLAAQVAVTRSLEDPRHDFEVNLGGTFNLLEGARANPRLRLFLFTSTNKVYGSLTPVGQARNGADRAACGEGQPLDFHSPYGCSKGGADQYARDYARVFGVPTVVFRMSCIYGPQQFGTEDQGWVAHFALAALTQRPLVLYGDGTQVRDLLFIDDLMDAIAAVRRRPRPLAGRIFNLGGGPANARSLLDIIAALEQLSGRPLPLRSAPWRQGDQRRYVSDTAAFQAATGWRPRTSVADGLGQLYRWLDRNRPAWQELMHETLELAS